MRVFALLSTVVPILDLLYKSVQDFWANNLSADALRRIINGKYAHNETSDTLTGDSLT